MNYRPSQVLITFPRQVDLQSKWPKNWTHVMTQDSVCGLSNLVLLLSSLQYMPSW